MDRDNFKIEPYAVKKLYCFCFDRINGKYCLTLQTNLYILHLFPNSELRDS